jgi:type IV pilus assembly protein PilA
MSLADGLKTPIGECANTLGQLAGCDSGTNGIAAAAGVTGNYVSSVTVADGVMTVLMRGVPAVSRLVDGLTVIYTPTLNAGSIQWSCTGGTVLSQHRPAACR